MIDVLLVAIEMEYNHLARSKAVPPFAHIRIMTIAKDAMNNSPEKTLQQLQQLKFIQLPVKIVTQLPENVPVIKKDMPPFLLDDTFAIQIEKQQWALVKIKPRSTF